MNPYTSSNQATAALRIPPRQQYISSILEFGIWNLVFSSPIPNSLLQIPSASSTIFFIFGPKKSSPMFDRFFTAFLFVSSAYNFSFFISRIMVNCMHREYVHVYIQPGFEHQLRDNVLLAQEIVQYLFFQWPRQGVKWFNRD